MYGANECAKNVIECVQTYPWLSNSMLNSLKNVPSHPWNSVHLLASLFTLMTMLFRLNEYSLAVNEQQKVYNFSRGKTIGFFGPRNNTFCVPKETKRVVPKFKFNGRTSADDRRTIHAGLKTLHNCMTQQSSIEAAKHTQETLETLAESCAQV